jgi:hypothetical protein
VSDSQRGWLWKMLLEVVLIGFAVFLGMAADQWRSDRQHRDQARDALQRFRVEIQTNHAAVEKVKAYHLQMRTEIAARLDPKTQGKTVLNMEGLLPVVFEHTAWDLALATQSLADIDPELSYRLARLYGLQQTYTGLTGSFLQSMYLRPPSEDFTKFLHSVKIWLDDIVYHEPALADAYQEILPLIDRALKD